MTALLPAPLLLPNAAGVLETYEVGPPISWARPTAPLVGRVAYAAAHVVPLGWSDSSPGATPVIDWDSTLGFRHELWSYGLGVADAMDTAQRGMGLAWPGARELIVRSAAEAASVGGRLACGAGTDQLDPDQRHDLTTILDAYREQIGVVREAGARVVLMASRALARSAAGVADYRRVYDTLLEEADEPVVLHWLGSMFDPALHGYWGSPDRDGATATFTALVRDHAAVLDGVKVSLLDAPHEVELRRALPPGVRLYTGDDFNYPELIVGDGTHHSDALLGVFAAIHPAASVALQALDAGDAVRAREVLDSTRALGRHLFSAPTPYYKTGIAFLAWCNDHQPGFTMLGGLQSGRSLPHLVDTFRLADRAGLLRTPDRAAGRLRMLLAVHGLTG